MKDDPKPERGQKIYRGAAMTSARWSKMSEDERREFNDSISSLPTEEEQKRFDEILKLGLL